MIKIYSKNNCMQCKMVKKYFVTHHIVFEEHNIDDEPQYIDYLKSQGFQAVPVVETPEHKAFYGFRPAELAEIVK